MRNTKTDRNVKVMDESLDVKQKAKAIIDSMFATEIDTTIVQKNVEQALLGDTHQAIKLMEKGDFELFHFLPKHMREDTKIVILAVKKNHKIYKTLPVTVRDSLEVKKATLISMISFGSSVLELISIVRDNSKLEKQMTLLLGKEIEARGGYFSDAISTSLYNIYLEDKNIYDKILLSGLITQSSHGVSLGSAFTLFLQKITKDKEFDSHDDSRNFIMQKLSDFLKIPNLEVSESLFKLCNNISQSISFLKIVSGKQVEVPETQEEPNNQDDINDEKEDLYQSYNYATLGTVCSVWDHSGDQVVLEKSVLDSMNTRCLDNYMNFVKLSKVLGLGFLIEKHARLIQIATGVDFYSGEGMTHGKTLLFFNRIGRSVGVPQKQYKDPDGNTKTSCFHSLESVKLIFGEIKETGNIGDLHIPPANKGSKSIVEIYMKHIGLITEPYGEISLEAMKKSR